MTKEEFKDLYDEAVWDFVQQSAEIAPDRPLSAKDRQQLVRQVTPSQGRLVEEIRRLRAKMGLNQKMMASQLGVTRQSLRFWESLSGHYPSWRNFERILLLWEANKEG